MPETEYVGWWWLPEDPDDHVPGKLSFSEQTGQRLGLWGAFRGAKNLGTPGSLGETLPIILGLIPKERVTLVSSTPIGRKVNSPGFDSTEYRVGLVCLGEFFETLDAVEFSEISFQPTYLADWLAEARVYADLPVKTETGTRYECGYEHQEPHYDEIANGRVALAYGMSLVEKAFSAEIKVTPAISLEMQARLNIDDWRRSYLLPITNLLSLATAHPVRTAGVVAHLGEGKESVEVRLIARHLPEPQHDDSGIRRDGMLFSYQEIQGSFGEVVGRWLKIHDELESVLNLYFSIGLSRSMYLEHQFLSVVQALEGYHRSRFSSRDVVQELHDARVATILKSAPSEHRGWLRQKLGEANTKGLGRRLRELVECAGGCVGPWCANESQTSVFVRRVYKARNVLTHYSPDDGDAKIASDELFELTEALSILMQALLLGELGFDNEGRLHLFSQNQRYQFAATRATQAG